MKMPGLLAASFAATATATAITSASPASSSLSSSNFGRGGSKFHPCCQEDGKDLPSKGRDESSDRFAPRFDGLRFIETLVTAHR